MSPSKIKLNFQTIIIYIPVVILFDQRKLINTIISLNNKNHTHHYYNSLRYHQTRLPFIFVISAANSTEKKKI
jgi:hypothetical protein